jgi:hypothetical protein
MPESILFARQNSVFKISSPQPSPAGEGVNVPNFDVRWVSKEILTNKRCGGFVIRKADLTELALNITKVSGVIRLSHPCAWIPASQPE